MPIRCIDLAGTSWMIAYSGRYERALPGLTLIDV
jgi:hypothetical protein